MRGFNKTAALAGVVLIMIACNKEEDALNNQEVSVRFSAQIGEQTGEISAQTRASGTAWAADDRIGVYAFNNGTATPALEMTNKEYMSDEAGTSPQFIPEDGNNIFFPVNGSQKFDFMAYYPYQGDLINYTYKIDVSNQGKPEGIDLLYANTADTETGGYDKNNSNVTFVFYHKLVKFTLETVAGKGLTDADLVGMAVTIKGMNTKADFDLETGELSNASSSADLIPVTREEGELYESIVLPAAVPGNDEWSVEFLVNGNTYKWEVPAIALKAGNEYIWKISVQKIPVLISGIIVPWERIPGSGDAW